MMRIQQRRCLTGIITLALAGMPAAQAQETAPANLLKNPQFAEQSGGKPAGWLFYENQQTVAIDTQEITGDSKQSLRVDIANDAGNKKFGQIVQKVPVQPGAKYRVKSALKSTKAGIGWVQIKLLTGKTENQRIDSAKSATNWQTVEKEFETGSSDTVWVVLRYRQGSGETGQKVWFASVSLTKE